MKTQRPPLVTYKLMHYLESDTCIDYGYGYSVGIVGEFNVYVDGILVGLFRDDDGVFRPGGNCPPDIVDDIKHLVEVETARMHANEVNDHMDRVRRERDLSSKVRDSWDNWGMT